ncbi:MAG TPA: hypothetical protein VKX39_18805 [Bryobacteraceae bacterium]|nr:hypothetical protein [Bryobacteraceae bacterium]
MKLLPALMIAALGAQAAGIGEVKTVYLLPMSSSLDQYLATHLTSGNVLQVVTDPKKADAILCDRIGATLDDKLNELYGKANPEPDSKDLVDASRPVVQSISHARGTIFLIDRKTRNVLWSVYDPPKSTSPGDLNRAAGKITARLAKDLKGK